VDSVFIEFDL